jgi:hypothetical protein
MTDSLKQIVKGNQAGKNLVLGDHNESVFAPQTIASENVKLLVAALQKEIEQDDQRTEWIEDLVTFNEPFVVDGVRGLEDKLIEAGLEHKRLFAILQKERFVKFLERNSLFHSAQQLLAFCLHEIFNSFEAFVHPRCGDIQEAELNELIVDKVVQPVLNQYSYGSFSLNHSLVWGMIYWLAERCYIRWHRVA